MKTVLMITAFSVISLNVFAQVDSAEKKMVPPDYATDSVYNSDRSHKQDSLKAVPDKTQVAQPQEPKAVQKPAKSQPSQNGYMLKNGKIYMIKNGQASSTVETVSLANGSRLMSDGTVIKSDGSKIKMKEGEFIDFSGTMMNPRPDDIQDSNTKPAKQNPPVDKSKEQKKDNEKNMYLVPDSSVQDYNKQNPK